ncbi:YtxH domain-containing protein [Candidatus Margulisiibacteriota bacterium]
MFRLIRALFTVIIGFGAGVLLAPWKGEESRKKLQESIEKGKEKFNELKDSFAKKEEE